MNYKEIKNILVSCDNYEVVKGIISFELDIEDEEVLDEATEFYFRSNYIPNFLDEEICENAYGPKYEF